MIKESTLDTIYEVYSELPEFGQKSSLVQISKRIGERYLSLAYFQGNQPVGFKLGYALNASVFYSWLGGVLPDHRKKGIALELLLAQESWVRKEGYRQLEVKSKNRFPGMLSLLIKQGYWINAVSEGTDPLDTKIHFFKSLADTDL